MYINKYEIVQKLDFENLDEIIQDYINNGYNSKIYNTITAEKYGLSKSYPTNEVKNEYDKLLDIILTYAIKNTKDEILPLCLFINYYKDGSDDCKPHTHGCRQLTVSFGNERELIVDGIPMIIKHGHGILLNGEEHSVPKLDIDDENYNKPRISFNLFFTTKKECNFNIFNSD